jgi:hypothetical protein
MAVDGSGGGGGDGEKKLIDVYKNQEEETNDRTVSEKKRELRR